MIHHISIPARDPVRVAAVLAELMNGRLAGRSHGDERRSARHDDRSLSDTITLPPGGDEAQVAFIPGTSASYVGFHALMSVPLDRAAIERIGMREGWRTRFFGRGAPGKPPAFHLLEFWVENRIMLELALRSARRIYRLHADRAHGRNHARPRCRYGKVIVYPSSSSEHFGEGSCPQNASETY